MKAPGQFLPLQVAALKLCGKIFASKDEGNIREIGTLLPYVVQLIIAAGGINSLQQC